MIALDADAPSSLFEASLPGKAAFVLGSETAGVSDDVRALVDMWVSIPMRGGVESLNVASAAAVLCFEHLRRDSSTY